MTKEKVNIKYYFIYSLSLPVGYSFVDVGLTSVFEMAWKES